MSKKEGLKGKAIDLAAYIKYSRASIVSKTLINKKVGTITLFAFDKGQSLSEHTAPYDAFVQVVEGEGEFIIAGKPVRAKTGEVVIMPADIPHAVKAVRKFKMLLVMIRA